MSSSHLFGQTLLTDAQQQHCRQRSNLVGFCLVAHAWLVIIAAMLLVVWWPNPLTYLIAVALIGGRQLGLAILMHDAAHRLLFDSPRLNDWVGQYVCGAPIGADMKRYRPYHLQHHRNTQTARDPDLELSAPFPISKASLQRKIRRDLLGITGYQRRLAQFRQSMGEGSTRERVVRLWQAEAPFLLFNATLAAVMTALGGFWAYPLLWLVPLMTWYQLASRIRNIAEHAVVGDSEQPLRNTRTTLARWWERALWAPYWVNYHLEHHMLIYCPCWKLPQLHRWLVEAGLRPRMELATGYGEVPRLATSRAHDDSGGQRKTSRVQAL
jgi:fatty acid desaturase